MKKVIVGILFVAVFALFISGCATGEGFRQVRIASDNVKSFDSNFQVVSNKNFNIGDSVYAKNFNVRINANVRADESIAKNNFLFNNYVDGRIRSFDAQVDNARFNNFFVFQVKENIRSRQLITAKNVNIAQNPQVKGQVIAKTNIVNGQVVNNANFQVHANVQV